MIAKLEIDISNTLKWFDSNFIVANPDRVHKRVLRILPDDHESTFEALLEKNDETNVHTQNHRVLMIEIYKHVTIPIHSSCRSIL